MCGIAGIIRTSGLTPQDRASAPRLQELLRHRGPDGAGHLLLDDAALVQTRLAIVDPRPHVLPLTDGHHTLLFNGEIYNHRELRRELSNYPFRTETDTETALAALLAWGPAALSRFEGMFALFLWDERRRDFLAAVDPLSVKPFLYYRADDGFVFCSEAGPLLRSGVLPFRADEEAVAEYLTAPYFSDVPFANLRRLRPGHFVTSEGEQAYRPATSVLGLAQAVQAHAETEVGLFLSGGVDSSLLAAIVRPMPAFTIRYEDQPTDYSDSLIVKSDDLPAAREVAALFGHSHHVVTPDKYEASLLRTLRTNDHISAWEQEVSQNILAEAAPMKAVLVGDAADETHLGYSFLLHPERIASPGRLMEFFGTMPLKRFGAEHFTRKYTQMAEAAGHAWRTADEQVLATSYLIRRLWLMRLLHNGDIQLMAHSVEGRVPFAHPALLALSAPPSIALRDGIEKHHLRSLAARYLPHHIAWRPKSALTKNLGARGLVHRLAKQAIQTHGDYLTPYLEVPQLTPPKDDRETGLQFRLLALLTWFERWR